MEEKQVSVPNAQLREKREGRGFTQAQVAEHVGVTEKTIGRWERGEAFPTAYARGKLCKLFEATPEELGLDRHPKPAPTPGGEEAMHRLSPKPSLIGHLRGHLIRRRKAFRLFVYAALIALLLGAGTGIALLITHLPDQAATGSSSSNTGSPPAQASPQTTVTSTPPAGWKQVLNDPLTFSHHDPDWANGPGCTFPPNAAYYDTSSRQLDWCQYNDLLTTTGDLDYTIQLAIHQGAQGGLMFRNDTNNNYYYFSITTTGNYSLTIHENAGNGNDFSITSGVSTAIVPGHDQWNTLEVKAQGNTFDLIINGHHIATVPQREQKLILCNFNPTSCSQGLIGVVVGSEVVEHTDVRFRNAVVWAPQ